MLIVYSGLDERRTGLRRASHTLTGELAISGDYVKK